MKNFLYTALIALAAISCTKDFETLNTNLNEPESVKGDFLLPTVIFDLADAMTSSTYYFGDIIAQYAAYYEFNSYDIYNWNADSRFWGFYSILQDVQDLEDYGVAEGLPNYEAVALILKAYMFSVLTDAYGDVPYSEALRADEGILAPKYDTQEAIYNGIFADLERANSLISGGSIGGDILFGGSMNNWKKFANSLHVRLLMRTAEVQDVSGELSKIVGDPGAYPLFAGNADNAVYRYSGAFPNISPVSIGRGREYDYFLGIPTNHLVNSLQDNDDPRIHEWLDYNGFPEYKGVAPGQDLGDIGRPVDFSTKDTSFYAEPAKIGAIFMTYSELNFLLAEAAERGIISGDAKSYYDKGVEASFEQWGVTMPADFLSGPALYESGNLEKLYVQKWLALYKNSIEAWFDWKRTGKPSFIQAGPGNVNDDRVPVRLIYPSIEQSVNAANYQAAVSSIGGDNINARVWWDQ